MDGLGPHPLGYFRMSPDRALDEGIECYLIRRGIGLERDTVCIRGLVNGARSERPQALIFPIIFQAVIHPPLEGSLESWDECAHVARIEAGLLNRIIRTMPP